MRDFNSMPERGISSLSASIIGADNAANLEDPENQDGVNELLADVTADTGIPIAVTYERIRHTLLGLGYVIPSVIESSSVLGDTEGETVIPLTRTDATTMFLYFAFVQNDDQTFDVFGEIMTQEELNDVLADDREQHSLGEV